MTHGLALIRFWQTQSAREAFLENLSREDLLACRLVCRDFAVQTAPYLFANLLVQFRSGTFTRPSRMAALKRIGCHVKSLTFRLPHRPDVFLPPLIDPVTGEEITFVYIPQPYASKMPGTGVSPRYGSWEMTDLLVKQYPPLFHAAANVTAFVQAFSLMGSLEHLKIVCEGQPPSHRYRRSVVDYALISLRIAIEQSPLTRLDSLTLLPIHPGALLYLQPSLGFGTSPASQKRWRQIRNLTIHMNSFPCMAPGEPTDHIKLLHAYLRNFSKLQRFAFYWIGAKGPCPISLTAEPCLAQQYMTKKPTQIGSKHPALRPLHFPELQYMSVENAIMDSSQVASFVISHRRSLREFNFEDVLLRSGTWDDALAPLTRISGSERWKSKQKEVMDVPIVLSPVGATRQQLRTVIRAMQAQTYKDRLCSIKRRAESFARARSKTRELFWATKVDDHMRSFFRSSVFNWL